MKYLVMLVTAVSLSLPLLAAPDPDFHAELSEYCKQRNECKIQDEKFQIDLKMAASCESYYKVNNCEEVKHSLGLMGPKTVMSCDVNSFNEFCSSVKGEVDLLDCTAYGINAIVSWKSVAVLVADRLARTAATAVGVSSSPIAFSAITVAGLPFSIYSAGQSAEACHKDLKYKSMAIKLHNLSLMEDEKTLDIEDTNLLKMQCHDLTKFLTNRQEVLSAKRGEKQAWSINPKMARQSPASKALYDSLKSQKCWNLPNKAQNTCKVISTLLIGGGAVIATRVALAPIGRVITSALKAETLTSVGSQAAQTVTPKALDSVVLDPKGRIPRDPFLSEAFDVNLIKPDQLKNLPQGTVLYNEWGEKFVVGVDKLSPQVNKLGFLMYGFKGASNPKIAPPVPYSETAYGRPATAHSLVEIHQLPSSMKLDLRGRLPPFQERPYTLNLLTQEQVRALPKGTVLYNEWGEKFVVGVDKLKLRGLNDKPDFVSYGVKVEPRSAPVTSRQPIKEIHDLPDTVVLDPKGYLPPSGKRDFGLNLLTFEQAEKLPKGTVRYTPSGQQRIIGLNYKVEFTTWDPFLKVGVKSPVGKPTAAIERLPAPSTHQAVASKAAISEINTIPDSVVLDPKGRIPKDPSVSNSFEINLIKPDQLKSFPEGTVLYDEFGKVVVGLDKLSTQVNKNGFLSYGFKIESTPKNAPVPVKVTPDAKGSTPHSLVEIHELPPSMKLELRGRLPANQDRNFTLNLLTQEQVRALPKGTVLYNELGDKFVVGVDKFKFRGRTHAPDLVSYGVKVEPRNAPVTSRQPIKEIQKQPDTLILDPKGYMPPGGKRNFGLNLLTFEQAEKLPKGTVLYTPTGQKRILGLDYKLPLTSDDFLQVGVKAP
jgi:uncharacterized protein YlzI (FlbEa/FlbD family)